MHLNRAYSVVDVKEMDDEKRIIRGMATTPTPDRVLDVVEPMGVKVASDIPLFLHHDSRLVVGRAVFGKATANGIPFEASIPKIAEPGKLRDRLDEAWQSVKYRLITGVSIGFKPVMEKIEHLKNGGMRFLESEVLELSLVPVPMNAEAVITQYRSGANDAARQQLLTSIKSADQAIRRAASGARPVVRLDPVPAASGNDPGVSGAAARKKGVVYLNPLSRKV